MANPDWKIKEWVSGRLPDFRVAEVALDGAPLPDFTYEIEASGALPDYTVQFVAEDATPRPDYRISQYMGGGGIPFSAVLALSPELAFRPAEAGSCFQERTGASATTPSGVGDPVGTIRNWGTLGGYLTAPSDAARPRLQVESGKSYLSFDGIDDVLLNASATALRAAAGWSLIMGMRNEGSSATARGALSIMGTDAANTRALILYRITTRLLQLAGRRIDGTSTVVVDGAAHNSQSIVGTALGDYTNTDAFIRANAVQEGTNASWLTAGTTANDGGAVLLGAFNATTPSNFFQGPIFSALAFRTVLTGADLTLAEQWTAQQSAITL